MKIEKLEITDGIRLENKSVGVQNIYSTANKNAMLFLTTGAKRSKNSKQVKQSFALYTKIKTDTYEF